MEKFRNLLWIAITITLFFCACAIGEAGGGEVKLREYAVKPGNTLGSIAYSLKVSRADLVRWNPGINPDRLVVGQKIKYRLPEDAAEAIKAEAAEIKAKIKEAKDSGAKEESVKVLSKRLAELFKAAAEIGANQKNGADKISGQLAELFKAVKDGQAEAKSQIGDWLFGLAAILLASGGLLALVFLKGRKKVRAVVSVVGAPAIGKTVAKNSAPEKAEKITLSLSGKKYSYTPEKKNGMFVSPDLVKNPKPTKDGDIDSEFPPRLRFNELGALKKSVAQSFRQKPELIEKEKKAGRLVEIVPAQGEGVSIPPQPSSSQGRGNLFYKER